MNASGHETAHCLVVGGGALGLLLAEALIQGSTRSALPYAVSLVNRSTLPRNVVFRDDAQSTERPLTLACSSLKATDWMHAFQNKAGTPLAVFLCLPSEETERVYFEWIEALRNRISDFPIQFVFCNNGILSKKTLDSVSAQDSSIAFLRAIFFIGSYRDIKNNVCVVRWTGGNLVRYGFIPEGKVSPSENKPFWMSTAHTEGTPDTRQTGSELGFLRWQHVEKIDHTERAKFFTNFVLAAAIGPHMKKNKALMDVLSASDLDELASCFEQLWKRYAIEKKFLLENLNVTVQLTGENYNSLSLQGTRGQCATMCYFISAIEAEIAARGQPAQCAELVEFVLEAKRNWRLSP